MDNNELYHYGVVGMRWGVRKDPERTRARREARAARYDKRAARYAMKSSKYRAKAHRGFLRTSAHAEYLRRSDRYDYKSKKAAEKASKIRNAQSKDVEKAAKLVAKSNGLTQRAFNVAQNNRKYNGDYYSADEARRIILKNEAKSMGLRDKARSLDANAGSGTYRVGNYYFDPKSNQRSTYEDIWNTRIPEAYSNTYGEELYKDKMKHSGINMRDVMEFAEYLDDCGATLQHAAIRKSRSKYKGGFVNGKNTSEYNHDYYIHNKDKWKDNKKALFDRWAHYFNNHYIDNDYYYDFKDGKVPWDHRPTGAPENSHLELVNNHWVVMPNGKTRRSSATRSLDPNEPMGTMYTLNNGKTYHYSSQNLHGTGSGGKKDPEFNKRNRPHSRKRAEATASGKVFRRPEVYNPLTGEYQSYTLGRGHGNNGLTPNPTKRSSGVTRSNNSDEERESKNRVGKYRTTNTRRKTRVVYPSSKDKEGTRYTDKNGLEWVKGSDDTWTTMRNNRVAIKTTKELKYGSPAQAAYNRLKRKVFKR